MEKQGINIFKFKGFSDDRLNIINDNNLDCLYIESNDYINFFKNFINLYFHENNTVLFEVPVINKNDPYSPDNLINWIINNYNNVKLTYISESCSFELNNNSFKQIIFNPRKGEWILINNIKKEQIVELYLKYLNKIFSLVNNTIIYFNYCHKDLDFTNDIPNFSLNGYLLFFDYDEDGLFIIKEKGNIIDDINNIAIVENIDYFY